MCGRTADHGHRGTRAEEALLLLLRAGFRKKFTLTPLFLAHFSRNPQYDRATAFASRAEAVRFLVEVFGR